ncbi:MAG: cation diffusion facilitator family transporter [Candidatus Nanopelagicales bacterium]
MSAGHAHSLTKWAWLSIGAAVLTIGMKTVAYLLTGSVGLLSDALESVVNLVAAVLALIALAAAAKPADEKHHFGHGKAEYLSAGAEGVMIVVAAGLIVYTAIERLINPRPLEELGIGLAVTLVATAINGAVGFVLLRQGRRHRSMTLVADGKHLMTDVYTSIGVIVGVGLVAVTGWLPLDSLVALAVGANILWTGFILIRNSGRGLLDHALPDEDNDRIIAVLRGFVDRYPAGDLEFHGLQTRESGRDRFVSLHVLVPGSWSVSRAHDLVEDVEGEIRSVLPLVQVHTHLESREDRRSHDDYAHGPRVFREETGPSTS